MMRRNHWQQLQAGEAGGLDEGLRGSSGKVHCGWSLLGAGTACRAWCYWVHERPNGPRTAAVKHGQAACSTCTCPCWAENLKLLIVAILVKLLWGHYALKWLCVHIRGHLLTSSGWYMPFSKCSCLGDKQGTNWNIPSREFCTLLLA